MSEIKVLISQSNYIPWKGYFDAISKADVFVIYDDMQYTRRDWRNRNKIKTQNGVSWLSIPVDVKGKFNQKINETRISDLGWAAKHWETIRHNYCKAAYFQEVKDFFEPLYLNCKELYLSEVNFRFIKACCDYLEIKTEFKWSSEFDLKGDKSEKLLNLCLDLKGSTYISGPAAKEYLDLDLFEKSGINLEWMEYSGYPEYPQLHGAFVHHVSILDLLFNTGTAARKYMKLSQHVG